MIGDSGGSRRWSWWWLWWWWSWRGWWQWYHDSDGSWRRGWWWMMMMMMVMLTVTSRRRRHRPSNQPWEGALLRGHSCLHVPGAAAGRTVRPIRRRLEFGAYSPYPCNRKISPRGEAGREAYRVIIVSGRDLMAGVFVCCFIFSLPFMLTYANMRRWLVVWYRYVPWSNPLLLWFLCCFWS